MSNHKMALAIMLCIICLVVLAFFVGVLYTNNNQTNMQGIRESLLYKNYILPIGKERIANIVSQTASMGQNPSRINQIAYLITQNFTDPNWPYQMTNETFCYYPNATIPYDYCSIYENENIPPSSTTNCTYLMFVSDKSGRIRQGCGPLGSDPYWIAYQRTGKCQELSIIFKKVTSEAGFDTRIVSSNGTQHNWNEVNINGEWKFFDLQKYGELQGKGDSSQWFGNRSDYYIAAGFPLKDLTLWGVCVHSDNSTILDVTSSYDPNNTTTPIKKC
jgi:hypothetical protein